MGLTERIALYKEIEEYRHTPLIAFVTSPRPGAGGEMAADCVAEFVEQLEQVPRTERSLDLLLISNGGDPTVSWRMVSLARERFKRFNVLLPYAAYSAATLLALGADEIVMHPNSNLGPVDPQITAQAPNQSGHSHIRFGSEDVAAFLTFVKRTVGLTDQAEVHKAFDRLCEQVGTVPIGVAARSAQLSLSLGQQLLKLHMKSSGDEPKVKGISEKLSRDFFHHGYSVGRSEARQLGLKVASPDPKIEMMLWKVWKDFERELCTRTHYNPSENVIRSLFSGLAAPAQPSADSPPPAPTSISEYSLVHAVMESRRTASAFTTKGMVMSTLLPDLRLSTTNLPLSSGWNDATSPALGGAPSLATGKLGPIKSGKHVRKKEGYRKGG